MDAIQKAESEARKAAELADRSASRARTYSPDLRTAQTSNTNARTPPAISNAGGLCKCLAKAPEPSVSTPVRSEPRSVSRAPVTPTLQATSVKAQPASETCSGLTLEKLPEERPELWTQISQQVMSGVNVPQERALLPLWHKYDRDGNGSLAVDELYQLLKEWAASMLKQVETVELPSVHAKLDNILTCKEKSRDPVALAIAEAVVAQTSAAATLYRTLVEGKVSTSTFASAFASMNLEKGGKVSKGEFISQAPNLFRACHPVC